MATAKTRPDILDGATVRPMTDDEFVQWQADCADAETASQAAAAAAAARASALAKLAALGLTDAEIAALVGA